MERYFIELLNLIFRIWTIIAFIRLFLQKGGLNLNHPLARFCINCTDFAIKRAKRYIKPIDGWDISIVVVVIISYFILHTFLFFLRYFLHIYPIMKVHMIIYIVGAVFIDTSYSFCYTLMISILFYFILIFSEVINPLTQVLYNILSPLSKLFGDIKIGIFNISLLIVFILLFFWVYFMVDYLFSRLIYAVLF